MVIQKIQKHESNIGLTYGIFMVLANVGKNNDKSTVCAIATIHR